LITPFHQADFIAECQGTRPAFTEETRCARNPHAPTLLRKIIHSSAGKCPFKRRSNISPTRGYEDKLRLLKHRRKEYLTLYSLNGQMDYMHGYMVPSSGYLEMVRIEHPMAVLFCNIRAATRRSSWNRLAIIQNC
jgi:hypothetical protein